jgi:hypothetical protein
MRTLQQLNDLGSGHLPGHLGVVITYLSGPEIHAEIVVHQSHMAPNGYLHAGTVVTLADTGRLWVHGKPAERRPGIHDHRTESELSGHCSRGDDRMRGNRRPPRQEHRYGMPP